MVICCCLLPKIWEILHFFGFALPFAFAKPLIFARTVPAVRVGMTVAVLNSVIHQIADKPVRISSTHPFYTEDTHNEACLNFPQES
jgi:hypothetical protein